ncbi:adenosylcobinamide-GDP ribazoletransferase [Vibrio hippocampi]|uniref:Adenosylcobinamide-GDP ribazoletransferase n=1 Tax=Vibrio hippocampi TaxID=654686 RepID=A0ABN8DFN9_9VIBR|nr:adenosylcobinamide-GDP ribazoletransferase [Vibrio hippocampi]CAH0526121.1 Adenosylcobinamide-GDP ribazoletransferase [Vibrio hippocampi]
MSQWCRYQVQLFCLAVSFFSRLPIPSSTPYSPERMNRAGRYFALVGTLLGLLCGLVFHLVEYALPSSVAVIVTMAFSLLLTGAFHEDGLADMADGIGGGMTVERRLAIMKDSRLGTYGTVTLVLALMMKFSLLDELSNHTALLAIFVLAYTYSRAVAASLISAMPYVSDLDTSKSKPLASTQTQQELAFLVFCGVLSSLIFGLTVALLLAVVAVLFRYLFIKWLTARLGGFTGDCLGAAQQIMELLIYLVLLVYWSNGGGR